MNVQFKEQYKYSLTMDNEIEIIETLKEGMIKRYLLHIEPAIMLIYFL